MPVEAADSTGLSSSEKCNQTGCGGSKLSLDHNFPRLAIEASTFDDALGQGAFDACLAQLRHDRAASPDTVGSVCRLSERLFHAGRRAEALECGRAAFAVAPDDVGVSHFCAWLFSNCGCNGEAAAAYLRLIDRRPDWAEGYRHASGAYLAMGDFKQAAEFAMAASDLAPANVDFALYAGCLLLDIGEAAASVIFLERAALNDPQDVRPLRALSAAKHAADRPDEAIDLALCAAALAPHDNAIAVHAAELLLRNGRFDDALTLLDDAIAREPDDAVLWRMISTVEAERGDTAAAIAAIDYALQLVPAAPEYHLHRGHLLRGCGDIEGAARSFERGVALDPDNPEARRAQLDLLTGAGRFAEAAAVGGEMLQRFPVDEPAAAAVLKALSQRLDAVEGEYVVVADRRRQIARADRADPNLPSRLRNQSRVVLALIVRETRTRFGDSRLGYSWALLEPMLHILLLSTVFSLLMHGSPPIGTHFFVFYYTGLIRYSGADGTKPVIRLNEQGSKP
ncbi:MAG: tetratricopeptide repeat protein [Alphaproteobacteria bacterium]|nr:tetratricopeptide repeat protein [Alphaproteobacteria bacterium]